MPSSSPKPSAKAPKRARPERSRADPDVEALGERVRALRDKASLTLEQLSARSGVSRAMLSKVERAEKSPTLSIVTRIARGLGVSLSALLGAEPECADVALIPRGGRLVYTDPQTGYERRLLSPSHVNNGVEVLMHVIPPHASSGELPPYTTRTHKYVVVHSGRLDLDVGGRRYVLGEGDAIYFEIKSSYALSNSGETPCICYIVIARAS